MPKYKIEMGQGIIVPPGGDAAIVTTTLFTCSFIAGYTAMGAIGAFHYPADFLKNFYSRTGTGADEVKTLIQDENFLSKQPVRDAMQAWIDKLMPTTVKILYGPHNNVLAAVDGPFEDRKAAKSIRKIEKFVQENVAATVSTQCSSSGVVARCAADGPSPRRFEIGSETQVRGWPGFAHESRIEMGSRPAGLYAGAVQLFGSPTQ